MITGCSSSNVYNSKEPSNSEKVTKKDLQFYIPDAFLEEAEEIQRIDDSLAYSLTYVKDKGNEYCCVNMESFLLYFFVEEDNPVKTVEDFKDLFYDRGLRFNLSESVSRVGTDAKAKQKIVIENVSCEALLSQEYYEDFTGGAALITDTYRSIGIFVGAIGRDIKLEKNQKNLIDEILDSLTTTKTSEEQIKERVVVTETIKEEQEAKVSFVNRDGILDMTELESIRVTDNDGLADFLKENKSEILKNELTDAPKGFEWHMVTMNGEDVEMLNVKVFDSEGNDFETGTRTYTILLSDNRRADIYLVPNNHSPYTLEFGEGDETGTLRIKE